MKIYIIVVEDDSTDTSVHPYIVKAEAVAEAERLARSYAREPEDYSEAQYDGWLFCAYYSCEGNKVTVREEELK